MPRIEHHRARHDRAARIVLVSATLALVMLSLGVPSANAMSDALGTLAKQLARLRGEVEGVSGRIEGQKAETRQTLRALGSQRAELELQARKEELRLKQLQQAHAKHKARIQAHSATSDAVRPVAARAIAHVRQSIARGLPFKRHERLAEVDRLDKQLRDRLLSPEKATARLWQLVEDELRLTRESGLYRQSITLGDEEVLADVARLGMVAMYFRTQDGRVGQVTRRGEDWAYEVRASEQERAQIQTLFDAFKKNIRVGFFTLPNALLTPPPSTQDTP